MPVESRYVDVTKLKTQIGVADASEDTALQNFITEIEGKADKVIEPRVLLLLEDDEDHVGIFDGSAQKELILNAFPIVSVTSVKISSLQEWDSVTALVENTDFKVDKKSGILLRRGCMWPDDDQCIQVAWRGGYAACPPDLEGALRAAVVDLRMRSLRVQGGQEQNEITGSSIPFARSDQYRSEWDDEWGLPTRTVAALMDYRP